MALAYLIFNFVYSLGLVYFHYTIILKKKQDHNHDQIGILILDVLNARIFDSKYQLN